MRPDTLMPMQNYTRDPCGIVHLVISDAGNIEGQCEPPYFCTAMARCLFTCLPAMATSTGGYDVA